MFDNELGLLRIGLIRIVSVIVDNACVVTCSNLINLVVKYYMFYYDDVEY